MDAGGKRRLRNGIILVVVIAIIVGLAVVVGVAVVIAVGRL